MNRSSRVIASGGTITTSGGYKIHTFTSSGTFTVTSGGVVDALVIGGGGGGGGGEKGINNDGGGGGGAGGYIEVSNHTVFTKAYTITVGNGGSGAPDPTGAGLPGNKGEDSVFDIFTAAGGGRGAAENTSGKPGTDWYSVDCSGGSGGGAGAACNHGTLYGGLGNTPSTSPSQGNKGGDTTDNSCSIRCGSGGGGAGGAGSGNTISAGGAGGAGRESSITGTSVSRAGGGGGGGGLTNKPGGSASSGGGAGGNPGYKGADGTANTGGGGGGGGANKGGGNGGSGIVIIRYKI